MAKSLPTRGGTSHHWKVYEAIDWSGELRAGSDAAEVQWMDLTLLRQKAKITADIGLELGESIWNLDYKTQAIVSHPDWQINPGLEPIWCRMLYKIGLI